MRGSRETWTIGGRCVPGLGALAGRWITLRRIRPLTRSGSALKGFRVTEKRLCWRWHTIHDLRLDSLPRQEKEARRFCGADSESRSKTWPPEASITGWQEIS